MGNRQNGDPRAFSLFRTFLAFFLSAVMGLAFVGVVNKAHDLFARSECQQPRMLGAGPVDWHGLPSHLLASTLCRRA